MKNNKIPFHKVDVSLKEINAVVSVLKSGWWAMGGKVLEFEKLFLKKTAAEYAIAVNSCTSALHLSLISLGIGHGDEVIVPVMTFASTIETILYTGATPVLVDIEKDTLNVSVEEIQKKISKKTKAIIIVDYAGQPCDFLEIKKIATRHKLKIIEDAAHTLPSFYKGKPIGGLADLTCFSFYVTKTLATADGGMITTNNKKLADKIRVLRLHGMNHDAWKRYGNKGSWHYQITELGYKYNMTDIDAALGLAQGKRNSELYQKRKRIAQKYSSEFKSLTGIIPPVIKPDRKTSWHLYVIKIEPDKLKINRDKFIQELNVLGIGTSVHFIPLYRHIYYKKILGNKYNEFPNSEWVYNRIISLPIFPSMTEKQINFVSSSVKEIVKKYQK